MAVLTQLPGVGEFTALVILAETGDISRFSSARKLAAWAGLTPTVRGSDRTVRHGRISKQGSAWLRWALGQAAQTAKRHPGFAPIYQAIAGRRGKQIATTAIARKLLTRAYHLLSEAGITGPAASPPPRLSREGRHAPGELAKYMSRLPRRARVARGRTDAGANHGRAERHCGQLADAASSTTRTRRTACA